MPTVPANPTGPPSARASASPTTDAAARACAGRHSTATAGAAIAPGVVRDRRRRAGTTQPRELPAASLTALVPRPRRPRSPDAHPSRAATTAASPVRERACRAPPHEPAPASIRAAPRVQRRHRPGPPRWRPLRSVRRDRRAPPPGPRRAPAARRARPPRRAAAARRARRQPGRRCLRPRSAVSPLGLETSTGGDRRKGPAADRRRHPHADHDLAAAFTPDAQTSLESARQDAAGGRARIPADRDRAGRRTRGGTAQPDRLTGEQRLPQEGGEQADERQQRDQLDGSLPALARGGANRGTATRNKP